jgi:hypothetical protein
MGQMSTFTNRPDCTDTTRAQRAADKLNASVRFALSTNPLNITESAIRIHAQIMLLNEIRSPVSDEVRDRFVHIYGTTPALSLKKRLGALDELMGWYNSTIG